MSDSTTAAHEKSGSKKIKAYSLDKSPFFTKSFTRTRVPAMNLALSADLGGGLSTGLTVIAGPSRHFKSNIGLVAVEAYLRNNPDATCIFYDSEFGTPPDYWESQGIDPAKIVHVPIMNIEQLKFDCAQRLDAMTGKEKVIIFIDSVGNLASKKEGDDALKENSAADMTRAKQLKSFFRIVTPYLTQLSIPAVVVAHTYDTQDMFPKKVISGGCLVYGTEIIMADGSLRQIQDVESGELVSTKLGAREVTNTWTPETLAEGTPECYEIEFDDGTQVQCSARHKFLIDGTWVCAEDLVEGQKAELI